MKEYQKRVKCAVCNSKLTNVLDLGQVPLAGYFPKKGEDDKKVYDLNLMLCPNCGLVQTDSILDPDILFKDYRYSSSVSLGKYFEDVAKHLYDKLELENKSVLEIGCNDGVLMEPLEEMGVHIMGIDPAENIAQLALAKYLDVEIDYFSYKTARKYMWGGFFDVVIANNTFAHISNIGDVLRGINYVLSEDGIFVFEVHYLKNLIEMKQWDNIYHEHIFYYSVTAINNFMKRFGMQLIDFEEISTHSGSIRFYAKKIDEYKVDVLSNLISNVRDFFRSKDTAVIEPYNEKMDYYYKVEDRINEEKELYGKIDLFRQETKDHIETVRKFVKDLKSQGKKIIGYGSSGRANMFCNIVGLTSNEIDYIVDESPERYGRTIPSMGIPIISREEMTYDADYVFIFAWNYSKMIMEKLKEHNFKYIVAFPEVQIVSKFEELKTQLGL